MSIYKRSKTSLIICKNYIFKWFSFFVSILNSIPVDTVRKLNVHKTFRRLSGRLLNVLCTFNLRPVSTGMGGVLSSSIVSERLKMRKSIGIHYWQDTIYSVKVSNNVININKLWGVLTSFLTLYYFSL